jgi:hypothetical protein
MPSFWQRLVGTKEQTSTGQTLVNYAESYLFAFKVGSDEEKARLATKLYEAANDVARRTGCTDFEALLSAGDRPTRRAAHYSRKRFDEIEGDVQDECLLSAYAVTHLMILNNILLLEDRPRAKSIATSAAHLYSGAAVREATA